MLAITQSLHPLVIAHALYVWQKNGWDHCCTVSLYQSLFIAQTIKPRRPSLACCYSAGPWVALPASQTGVP